MKNSIIIALLIFMGLGCSRDEDFGFVSEADLETFYAHDTTYNCQARKVVRGLGEIKWEADAIAYQVYDSSIQINILNYVTPELAYFREWITFPTLKSSAIKGEHDLNRMVQNGGTLSYSRMLSDGDVLDGFWVIDTLKPNKLDISVYNEDQGYVDGTFDLYFKIDMQGHHGVEYSENIEFREASFRAKIE